MSRPAQTTPSATAQVMPLAEANVAFHEREILHRDILNALPAAIYTTDADGRITFYNEACVEFSGRRPVLGEDEWCVTWKLFRTDGTPLPHDQCPMAVALKEGRPVRGAEAIAERPDGTRVAFIPYPTPLRDAEGKVVGAVNMLVDISDRKAAEERQTLLANEVNHRANNLLAVVQATLRLTQADTVAEYKAAIEGRIGALAHAHSLLAKSRWAGADLQHLITEEMAPYMGGEQSRCWISGPILPLEPAAAQSVAMIVHELATNAAKYGPLSGDTGKVLVEWRHVTGARLILRWTEEGGPAVRQPARRGVGGKVIDAAVAQLKGKVRFDWRAEGLLCEIDLPASKIAGR